MKLNSTGLLAFAFLVAQPSIETAALSQPQPAVKMSRSGICHPKGGTYYSRTKNFKPFPSMKACLDAGGRRPKK